MHNQPFTINQVAATLIEFKKLPSQLQAKAFLRRLGALFPRGKSFLRKNLAIVAYETPDTYGLATGWQRDELSGAIAYLLGAPWLALVREGFIAEALSGNGFHEITDAGWVEIENPEIICSPDRKIIDALRFLHHDLQDFEHYFREGKCDEAVRAAFIRVENRLNEIREFILDCRSQGRIRSQPTLQALR